MGTPEPKYPLSGHCSIIHDGTLYVYSPAGFQSLRLEEGAKWKTLPMDISLTGAKCVKAAPKGDKKGAKLYIVGGSVNDTAATWDYPGMMHYTFSEKKWDWLRAESWTTQNRQNHAAVYLEDSQKILVYSGSSKKGDASPSSESFLFSTNSPYSVASLPSDGAPPLVNPTLLSSDAKSALLVGGSSTNAAVWKFSEKDGWEDLGVSLEKPITEDRVQCAVVTGKDGSTVLEKFDMSVSPNKVERILLLDKNGKPAKTGTTVGDKKKGGKVKRVTVSDWSSYNGTFAPKSTRSGYSLAQGDNGLTVATGGSKTDPLVVFDAQENSWMNATALFSGQEVLTQSKTSSSTGPTSTPTSAPTSAPAVPAGPPDNKNKMMTVLGATLGTIFGIAAVLILILFCLKYRKNKSKQTKEFVEKDQDRMSFADRGADFMKEAGGSVAHQSLPYQQNNDSLTSLAIIQGRGATGHKKNAASDASTAGLMKKPSPLGYSENVELSKFDLKPEPAQHETMVRQNSGRTQTRPPPEKAAARSRSSGWSRYFANNEATNLATMPTDRSTYASDRTSAASQSQYTNSRMCSQRPSQQIAPLEIPKLDGQRLNSVASGSPTLGGSPNGLLPHQVQPMQAELGRADSNGSSRSGVSSNRARNDHYFRQPVDSWSPMGDDRRASSNYTGSVVIEPNSKYAGVSSYYADGHDSFYPKSNVSSFYPGQADAAPIIPDARDSTFTMFPTGNAPAASNQETYSNNIGSMLPPPRFGAPQDRESTVTIFPGPNGSNGVQQEAPSSHYPSSFYPPPRVGHESSATMFPGPGPRQDDSKNGQSDMSWLNLGVSR